MENYVTLAVKANKEDDVKTVASKNGQILKSKIEAKIKLQESKILEAKLNLDQAVEDIKTAQGYITKDADHYLEVVFSALNIRDEFAEILRQEEITLEELVELVKIF